MRALVRVSGYLFRILSGPIPSRIPRTFACAKDAPLHSLIFNFFFYKSFFTAHTYTYIAHVVQCGVHYIRADPVKGQQYNAGIEI